MKIAITGGSGFIGQRLKPLLEADGHQIEIVDLRHDRPVDLLDLAALTDALRGCDAVYHLAAEHRDDVTPRSRYYDVNVDGTRNLTKACDANGITRLIFTSSFAVYGLDARTPDETSAPAPFNDYGRSKLAGEQALQDWQAANARVNLTVVRPVVIFGEGNRGNVYTLMSQVAAGRFVMIGDGGNKKSIAYVGNMAAFLKFLLPRTDRGAIYNYADGPDLTTRQLVDTICSSLRKPRPAAALPYALGLAAGDMFDGAAKLTGRKFPISAVRVQKFCADTTSDASKSRSIGFAPPFTLAEGIERMIAHDFAPAGKKAA